MRDADDDGHRTSIYNEFTIQGPGRFHDNLFAWLHFIIWLIYYLPVKLYRLL